MWRNRLTTEAGCHYDLTALIWQTGQEIAHSALMSSIFLVDRLKESTKISMVMVVEFHSEASEIQYVFAPQWIPSKDFLDAL